MNRIFFSLVISICIYSGSCTGLYGQESSASGPNKSAKNEAIEEAADRLKAEKDGLDATKDAEEQARLEAGRKNQPQKKSKKIPRRETLEEAADRMKAEKDRMETEKERQSAGQNAAGHLPASDISEKDANDKKASTEFSASEEKMQNQASSGMSGDETAINTDALERLAKEAERNYDEGKYIIAYDKFRELSAASNPGGYKLLAKQYSVLIKNRMQKILNRKTDPAGMKYASGLISYMDNDHDKCIASWKEYLKADPGNNEVKEALNLLQTRDNEKKMERAQKGISEAKTLLEKKEYENAMNRLGEISELSSEFPEINQLMKELQSAITKENHYGNSEETIKAETESDLRQRRDNYYKEGLIQFDKGNFARASDYFNRCLAIDPNFTDAGSRIKEANAMLKNYPSSGASSSQNIIEAENYYHNGMVKYKAGYYQKAISQLEEALRCYPGYTEASEALKKIKSEYRSSVNNEK